MLRFISLCVCLLSATDARCDPLRPPFVASFERFVRTGDVSSAIGGRLLLADLNCTACHDGQPDQSTHGPLLDGVGNRLQGEWLKKFLANPSKVKLGTKMPNVLHGLARKEKDRTTNALVAFLTTQREPFPKLKSDARNPIAHEFWLKGNALRGRKLYHQIGCVACHEPDKNYEIPPRIPSPFEKLLAQMTPDEIKKLKVPLPPRPVESVPHGDLTAKYTRRSLAFFLLNPETVRPDGRMPNFHLSPNEAADVAEYLLRGQSVDVKPIDMSRDDALIQEGRELFVKLQCAQCHSIKGVKPAENATPLAKIDANVTRSCLGKPKANMPVFALDVAQRKSLQLAIADIHMPQSKTVGVNERIEQHMLQLNCYACHRRDKRGGVEPKRQAYFETVGHVDIGDEGKLPPSLDSVGIKLKIDWLRKVFAGTGNVRPFMTARMPKFPAAIVKPLPQWFADADGKAGGKTQIDKSTKYAQTGRVLLNNAGCLQCHSVRGEHLPGVVGVDIAQSGNRLHSQWFRDFLLDPAKLKPGTRMPTFFPNGKSQFPKILDGDVNRQIGAMWAYLNEAARLPLPEKLLAAKVQNFELVPEKRPVLLRTFMKEVGPMAIAVGFPQKVHIAFDAQDVRIALAWRGRFLDAHGTWFNRLAPPAQPLGNDVIALPPGVPFVLRDGKQPEHEFRGYRLDAKGVPTFLYRFGPVNVEDRFEPGPQHSLRRRLQITPVNPQMSPKIRMWLRANAGGKVHRLGSAKAKNEAGLTTMTSQAGELYQNGRLSEWRVPIEINRETVIDVNYQW